MNDQITNIFFDETFKLTAEIARKYYFGIFGKWDPEVPALENNKVNISEEGWSHLHHKARSKVEMLTRYFALPKAAAVLLCKEAIVEYRKGDDGKSEFWALFADVDGVIVKVVIRSINGGIKHFYSVVWKGEVKELREDDKKRAASRLYPRCGGIDTPQLSCNEILQQMSEFVKKHKNDPQPKVRGTMSKL